MFISTGAAMTMAFPGLLPDAPEGILPAPAEGGTLPGSGVETRRAMDWINPDARQNWTPLGRISVLLIRPTRRVQPSRTTRASLRTARGAPGMPHGRDLQRFPPQLPGATPQLRSAPVYYRRPSIRTRNDSKTIPAITVTIALTNARRLAPIAASNPAAAAAPSRNNKTTGPTSTVGIATNAAALRQSRRIARTVPFGEIQYSNRRTV